MTSEEQYLEHIKAAITVGLGISTRGSSATHSHGVSMTNLRTAEMWAEADQREKANRAQTAIDMTE